MESLNNNVMLLQCFKLIPSEGFPTDEQQQEQESPESKQETPELKETPSQLDSIEFRMQKLHNRRLLLLKIQQFINKAEQNSDGTKQEITSDEEQCELEAIQSELKELEVRKAELEKNGETSKPQSETGQQGNLSSYKETPRGGIYMLPPPQLDHRDVTATAETATHTVLPVEDLGQTGGVTKCPGCEAIVVTETDSSMGEAAWIMCILSLMMGCVAGCCLIPFYMKRFRDVHHKCPMCQAHIYTHQPL